MRSRDSIRTKHSPTLTVLLRFMLLKNGATSLFRIAGSGLWLVERTSHTVPRYRFLMAPERTAAAVVSPPGSVNRPGDVPGLPLPWTPNIQVDKIGGGVVAHTPQSKLDGGLAQFAAGCVRQSHINGHALHVQAAGCDTG